MIPTNLPDSDASRFTEAHRLSDEWAQWQAILYVLLPFAAASLLIYFAAGRDLLLYPHSASVLSRAALDILTKLAFGACLWLAPLALPWIRPRPYMMAAAPIISILFFPNMMYALEYRELISIGAVEASMSTNWQETSEFLSERSRSVYTTLICGAVVVVTFIWAARRIPQGAARLRVRTKVVLFAVTLVVLAIGSVTRPRVFPVTSIKNTAEYFAYVEEMRALASERASFVFGATRSPMLDYEETYVIVIGESLRRRQLSLYGYGRSTTPRLDTTANLIVFHDVISATGTSQSALKSALTPATSATVHYSTMPSILRIAREIGFSTTWISNQDRVVDTEIVAIANDADTTIFTNHDWAAFGRFDEAIFEPLHRALAGEAKRKFIVVHLMGSHGEYGRRYPKSFARFTSSDCRAVPGGCARAWTAGEIATINEYDNSVAYTDAVVSEIIQLVAHHGGASAVMFFADHGEELFDTSFRRMGHGFQSITRYEVEIPAFLWLSPELTQHRSDLAASASDNRFRAASSEDFFYAMADLMESDFPLMKRERSIFSPSFREQRRIVATPDRHLVDFACLQQPSRDCARVPVVNALASGIEHPE